MQFDRWVLRILPLALAGTILVVFARHQAFLSSPPRSHPTSGAYAPAMGEQGPELTVAQFIRDLGSNDPDVRERASRELERIGKPTEQALKKALESSPDAEVRSRAQAILLNHSKSPEEWLVEVRADLAQQHVTSAIKGLAEMIERFPEAVATVRARALMTMILDDPTSEFLTTSAGPGVATDLATIKIYDPHWLIIATTQYEGIMQSLKLINLNGELNRNILAAGEGQASQLLDAYLEQGYVLYELGKCGEKPRYESTLRVCENILRNTEPGSESWWSARYLQLVVYFRRMEESTTARMLPLVGVEYLERMNPNFDGNKYGMANKIRRLKKLILEATNRGK